MKAAIYTRVSTYMQVDEGFSLEAQFDDLKEYVKKNGWDLIRVYTDPGVSAKDLKRPAVEEMIRGMKDHLFEAVVVHKLDRLTRNLGDLHDLVELVNQLGIKLVSVRENIDTSTPAGRMFIYFLGIFAEMFRDNLKEEVTKGMTKRAKAGLRNTFAPIGYELIDGKLVIVPEQAKIIQEIFSLLINQKMGYLTIAKHMNERRISGLRGGSFYSSSIEAILKNYTYIGMNHWKAKGLPESERIIVEGEYESIIDKKDFEKAQQIIRKRERKDISRSSYDYPFSTILKCGKCGGPFHGAKNAGGYYYYRCFNKLSKSCDQSDISELKMEKLFFEYLKPKKSNLTPLIKKPERNKERSRIEQEITRSENRRRNWQYAFGDGTMPYQDYVKLIDEEMEKVKKWEEQLNEIPENSEVSITPQEMLDAILELHKNWGLIERENKKKLISTLFRRIVISKTNKSWIIESIE